MKLALYRITIHSYDYSPDYEAVVLYLTIEENLENSIQDVLTNISDLIPSFRHAYYQNLAKPKHKPTLFKPTKCHY